MSVADDMVRAMTLLRGLKHRRNEPWTQDLDSLEKMFRRQLSPSVAVCSVSDSVSADEHDVAMQPILLTTGQAGRKLNVSETTVRKHIREGSLKVVRIGRSVRIHVDEIERFAHDLQPNALHVKDQQ